MIIKSYSYKNISLKPMTKIEILDLPDHKVQQLNDKQLHHNQK